MTDHSDIRDAEPVEPTVAIDTIARVGLMISPMLPGCTARRYVPPYDRVGEHIWPCFANDGPIVPILAIRASKYVTLALAEFTYIPMFIEGHFSIGFSGAGVGRTFRLDAGPDKITEQLCESLATFDFAKMVANGTVENLMTAQMRFRDPWNRFKLASSAIYLGRFGEAEELLHDGLTHADDQARGPSYIKMVSDSRQFLLDLKSDPEGLRERLHGFMERNWSSLSVAEP